MNKKCILLFYFTSVNITFMFYKGTTISEPGVEGVEKNKLEALSKKKTMGILQEIKKAFLWKKEFSKVFPAEKRNSFSIFPWSPPLDH